MQGWAADRKGGSWTWADLVVCGDRSRAGCAAAAAAARGRPGGAETAKGSSIYFRKDRLYTNEIAEAGWQDHSVKLGEDEPLVQFANKLAAAAVARRQKEGQKEEQRQRLQGGKQAERESPLTGSTKAAGGGAPGLRIELKIRSKIGGWVHHVKKAAITVELVPL